MRELCKDNFSALGLKPDRQRLKVCVVTVVFVLDLLRLYCEETHCEVLMDPLESADKLKPATLSLCAFIKTLPRMKQSSQQG